MISIRKRNELYEYRFEAGKVNEKRKQISKSGFKTQIKEDIKKVTKIFEKNQFSLNLILANSTKLIVKHYKK